MFLSVFVQVGDSVILLSSVYPRLNLLVLSSLSHRQVMFFADHPVPNLGMRKQ